MCPWAFFPTETDKIFEHTACVTAWKGNAVVTSNCCKVGTKIIASHKNQKVLRILQISGSHWALQDVCHEDQRPYRERQERCKMLVTATHNFSADVLALSLSDSSFTEVSLQRIDQSKCIRLCLILKCAIKNTNSAVHKEEFARQNVFHI